MAEQASLRGPDCATTQRVTPLVFPPAARLRSIRHNARHCYRAPAHPCSHSQPRGKPARPAGKRPAAVLLGAGAGAHAEHVGIGGVGLLPIERQLEIDLDLLRLAAVERRRAPHDAGAFVLRCGRRFETMHGRLPRKLPYFCAPLPAKSINVVN